MKQFVYTMAVCLGLAMAPAVFAAENPQQGRMKACNADAGDKKGDERKAFMKDCLSKKAAEAKEAKAKVDSEKKAARTAQQEKMKSCNKDAGEKKMKGDERKKFMSSCLKG